MTLRDIIIGLRELFQHIGQDLDAAAHTSFLDWPLYLVAVSGLSLCILLGLVVFVILRYQEALVRAGLLIVIWLIFSGALVLTAVGFGFSVGWWTIVVPTILVAVLQGLAEKGRSSSGD